MTQTLKIARSHSGSRQLAQINIGRLRYPRDDHRPAGWRDNIDRINRLAEASPGFVWRLAGADGEDTGMLMWGDPGIVTNMSVWETAEQFKAFVYRSEHMDFMKSRERWFEKLDVHMVLWWIDEGQFPNLEDGNAKLDQISNFGTSGEAFTLKTLTCFGHEGKSGVR